MNVKIINAETKEPVPFASIMGYLNGGISTGLGAVANINGVVSMPLQQWQTSGVQYINISSIGYVPASVNFNNSLEDAEIELQQDTKTEGEVIVTGSYKKKATIIALVSVLAIIAVVAAILKYRKL